MLEHYLSVLIRLVSMVAALLLGPSDGPATLAAGQIAPPVQFHEARLPSGVRLRYVDQGPVTGPAVLMLHGYTDSSFSFSRVSPLDGSSLDGQAFPCCAALVVLFSGQERDLTVSLEPLVAGTAPLSNRSRSVAVRGGAYHANHSTKLVVKMR